MRAHIYQPPSTIQRTVIQMLPTSLYYGTWWWRWN